MVSNILEFTKTPIRAYVVIPDDDPKRDFCLVKRGGYPIEDDGRVIQGTLRSVIRQLQEQRRALRVPITVHPECKRRAAA